jgi:hypothetical protein
MSRLEIARTSVMSARAGLLDPLLNFLNKVSRKSTDTIRFEFFIFLPFKSFHQGFLSTRRQVLICASRSYRSSA